MKYHENLKKTKYEKAMELSDEEYRRLCGYTKKTMLEMESILREAHAAKHKRRGRHSKLDVADMLMLACKYWREYVMFFSPANEYGVAESTAHDITMWVENVLIKSGKFGLPGKKLLTGDGLEAIVVDVTESPKMLTQQLRELEEDGLIIRKVYPALWKAKDLRRNAPCLEREKRYE